MKKPLRAAQSFSEDEAAWLAEALTALMRGGKLEPRLRKSPALGSVAHKVRAMGASIERQRAAAMNGIAGEEIAPGVPGE